MRKTKACIGCQRLLPATRQFFSPSQYADGLKARCKQCCNLERHLSALRRERKASLSLIKIPAARALRRAGFSPDYIAKDLGVDVVAVTSYFSRRAA